MEFTRTVRVNAPLSEVSALTDEIETVAGCIPGLHDLRMLGPNEFDCIVTQRVGSVKANFDLHNEIVDIVPDKSLTVVSEGRDKALSSSVKAHQTFSFTDRGDETEVDIAATIQVTGRIATFGHRVILSKAEQVTLEALENVSKLLEERRADTNR